MNHLLKEALIDLLPLIIFIIGCALLLIVCLRLINKK